MYVKQYTLNYQKIYMGWGGAVEKYYLQIGYETNIISSWGNLYQQIM